MLLLTTAQKVQLSIRPVDAYGNPARIDGTPTWSSSDASIGTMEVAPDGLSAYFITAGVIGLCQVSVQADADLGSGTRTIAATLDIQVEPSEAVALSIISAAPEGK